MSADDLPTRLRHLAVDYSQNEHLPDSDWMSEAAARIEELEGFRAAVIREYNQQVSVIFPSIEAALMKEDTP